MGMKRAVDKSGLSKYGYFMVLLLFFFYRDPIGHFTSLLVSHHFEVSWVFRVD